jgi:adenylate cyclase
LALVLNKYLSPMTEILMKYDGYVDKYEGDAIMCDFGVPMEDPDHAWKACFAALDQQATLEVLRPQIKKDHGVDIFVRMGVNSGIVSAGNMGSNQRFQYTVMGDAVNQASRFEGAIKAIWHLPHDRRRNLSPGAG